MPNITFTNQDGETFVMPNPIYAPPIYPYREDDTPFKTYYSRSKLRQMRKKRRSHRKNNN